MSDQGFTGERFILGQGGVQLAYEHLHRYLFASRFAPGKKALDVASGSGYGAALLANVARHVWAVDIDGPTVAQARRTYSAGNLSFINADGSRLPIAPASVDLITAFEVIEHVPDQEEMVRELARALRPGGIGLISTPNKAIYSDARKYVNPYHLREFYRDEFCELLQSEFSYVHLMLQQIRAGSLISADSSAARPGEVLTSPMPGQESLETAPMYFLAFCSDRLPQQIPEDSAYLDPADSLFLEWMRHQNGAWAEIGRLNEEIRRLGRWGLDLEGQLAGKDETLTRVLGEVEVRDRTIESLQDQMEAEKLTRDETIRRLQSEIEQEVKARDRIINNLQAELARETSDRDEIIGKLREDFEERTKWALSLQDAVRDRDDLLLKTNASLDAADASLKVVSEHLARIRHAFLYRALCRLGILPK